MKLLALAVDFDGTIAHNDVLDPGVRQALAEIRSRGVTVILVTGRILDDLRRVAGDLHFVDAVVAENGAVIEFPGSGYSSVLGPPVPQVLVSELHRERIACGVGRSIVDVHRNDAAKVLSIIERLELPLALVFNRSRMMVLPQAISKATGLHRALAILRLSEHNSVGIGDAENDHELLRICEVAVAVAWGSEALKAFADQILEGSGPPAVAGYVRELSKSLRIPVPAKVRRNLLLGHTDEGKPLGLAVRGRNVLIAGDPKSGKSWVAGLLCEQLILFGYSLCILDPEGDYTSLEALPGVVVFGGAHPVPLLHDLLRTLRHADVSVVIDLSHASQSEKVEYMRSVLPALATLRRKTGLPHRIIVDEAHYFLNDPDLLELLDLEQSGYTLVTYRATELHPALLAASEAVIVTRESDPREIQALRALCESCHSRINEPDWKRLLENLVVGEAVALPVTQEAEGHLRRIRLTPRLTPHIRHLAKYIDIPVAENRAFVFWSKGVLTGDRARTLREFTDIVEHSSTGAFDGHFRRCDFSNWIENVFGDYPLAQTVRAIEGDYRNPERGDAVLALTQAIRSRYEFAEPLA